MRLPLRSWRLAREKTQEEMAKLLSISRDTYIAWEQTPSKISIKAGQEIAEYLEVPFDDIIFLP